MPTEVTIRRGALQAFRELKRNIFPQ